MTGFFRVKLAMVFQNIQLSVGCRLLLAALLVIILSGCAHRVPADAAISQSPNAAAAAIPSDESAGRPYSGPYLLQVGDVIDIKFYYTPELNENLVVRPDGKISLQLIGEVQAAGLGPAALEERLKERYQDVLLQNELTVVVREYAEPLVYIGGEVAKPGALVLNRPTTVLQAVLKMGDFTVDAERRNVVVLRNSGDGQPLYINLNLRDYLAGLRVGKDSGVVTTVQCWELGETMRRCSETGGEDFAVNHAGDIWLQPLDVVYVPEAQISQVADFFDRYLGRILPVYRNLGLNYSYDLNPEVQVETRP